MVGRDGFSGVGFERMFFAREIEDSSDFLRDDNLVGFGFGAGCATFLAGPDAGSGAGSVLGFGSGLGGGWDWGSGDGLAGEVLFTAACCFRYA